MKKRDIIFTLVLFLGVMSDVLAKSDILDKNLLSIIPQPRFVSLTGTDFVLTNNTHIYSLQGEQDEFGILTFNEFVNENYGVVLKPLKLGEQLPSPDTILAGNASKEVYLKEALAKEGIELDPNIADEGYQLWVNSDRIIIHANTAAGRFYGLQTLKQLVYRSGGIIGVHGVAITDYPRYQLRGFQFDAGRCPQSIPAMKRIIRICSFFKLNFVLFREGDDELNAVKYKTNKLGSTNPCGIEIDQIAKFIQYAQKHHIQVIPEIESLGHSGAKAFLYPELIQKGGVETQYEGIGTHIRKRRLDLQNPKTYDLLRSIYSEWIPIITSPYIHLGCDEAGEGTDEHLARLTDMLNELGNRHNKKIRPIVWADGPVTPKHLKHQVVRCLWHYGETGKSYFDINKKSLQQNQNINSLVEPDSKEEVIMAGGSSSSHQPLAKAEYEAALTNIYSWCQYGKNKANFIGILAVQWHGNQLDLWLPDNLAAAEYGWTPDKPEFEYTSCITRIHNALAKIKDYTNPKESELNRPCWDGIWLDENDHWGEDIMKTATDRK